MKLTIYISGITGTILLTLRLLGIFLEFSTNDVLLISGLIMLVLVYFPLMIIEKRRHHKKIDGIIKSYEGRQMDEKNATNSANIKGGWGMNDSPFRERKSGLSWGGGNVHAANASRGSRRSFLKK